MSRLSGASVTRERGAVIQYAGPEHGTRDICRASAQKPQMSGVGSLAVVGIRDGIGTIITYVPTVP